MPTSLLIIIFIQSFVWMLPPFRQYRTQYFLFFLLLAIPDLLIITYHYLIGTADGRLVYLVHVFLLNFSLITDYNKLKKISPLLLLAAGFIWYYSSKIESDIVETMTGILFIPVFLVILKRTTTEVFRTKIINVFMFVLLLYSTTIILKFLYRYIDPELGLRYFNFITAFNILIGLFFCFFNYRNSPRISLEKYFNIQST